MYYNRLKTVCKLNHTELNLYSAIIKLIMSNFPLVMFSCFRIRKVSTMCI